MKPVVTLNDWSESRLLTIRTTGISGLGLTIIIEINVRFNSIALIFKEINFAFKDGYSLLWCTVGIG